MKKVFLGLLTLACCLSLFSCKEKNNGEEYDFSQMIKQKTTIRVWIDDEAGEYMQAVIKAFNEENPDIIVEHQHMGSVDARDKLKTFGPSGNGADVFQFPHDHLAQAIKEDLVYALNSQVQDRMKTRIHETALDIATMRYDDNTNQFSSTAAERLFAIPMSIESVVLFYNKDLVATPHTTFEALVSDGLTWQTANPGNFYLGTSSHWADGYFNQCFFSAFGFRPFGANGEDSSAVGFVKQKEAIQWMKTNIQPITTGVGATHNSQNAGSKFESGDLPYIIGGPWNLEAYKNAGINLGVTTIPTINGKATSTFAGSIMAAVYKYSKHTEEATKFVEFLASDKAMEIQYEYKTKLGALKADLLPQTIKADESLMVVSKQLETSIPMPTIPSVTNYWGPAETLVTEAWKNIDPDLDTLIATAENNYRSQEGLG